MKSSRVALPKAVALPPSYDAFFSFHVHKTGYCGVATYTKRAFSVPLKAEEGLTSLIQPKPPISLQDRISASYPSEMGVLDTQEHEDTPELDLKTLDSEGRAVTIDLGLFVLINLYVPNHSGTPEREAFKMAYHRLLAKRVDILLREGREVIVVGDLNAVAAVEDHVEGPGMMRKEQERLDAGLGPSGESFWDSPWRRWMRDWIIREDNPHGKLVDIVRKKWPDRKDMYTCKLPFFVDLYQLNPRLGWNTKLSARASNYGARIDYILITPGLEKWIKTADIQADVKGSDHCPVYVDLFEEIEEEGRIVKLRDLLGKRPSETGEPADPPPLASKHWDEYSGKQKLLSSFFSKGKPTKEASSDPEATSGHSQTPTPAPRDIPARSPSPSLEAMPDVSVLSPAPPPTKRGPPMDSDRATSSLPMKKSKVAPSKEKERPKPKASGNKGQPSIAAFFGGPSQASSSKAGGQARKNSGKGNVKAQPVDSAEAEEDIFMLGSSPPLTSQYLGTAETVEVDEEADYRLALALSQQEQAEYEASQSQPPSSQATHESTRTAWQSLLKPLTPPLCTVHGEPTKEWTVNKTGPNKGKRFYLCARPLAPGWGAAGEGGKGAVGEWRCDYFKWAKDVKRGTNAGKSG